jgi:hypothetical protein
MSGQNISRPGKRLLQARRQAAPQCPTRSSCLPMDGHPEHSGSTTRCRLLPRTLIPRGNVIQTRESPAVVVLLPSLDTNTLTGSVLVADAGLAARAAT